jgi:hypothetical protein
VDITANTKRIEELNEVVAKNASDVNLQLSEDDFNEWFSDSSAERVIADKAKELKDKGGQNLHDAFMDDAKAYEDAVRADEKCKSAKDEIEKLKLLNWSLKRENLQVHTEDVIPASGQLTIMRIVDPFMFRPANHKSNDSSFFMVPETMFKIKTKQMCYSELRSVVEKHLKVSKDEITAKQKNRMKELRSTYNIFKGVWIDSGCPSVELDDAQKEEISKRVANWKRKKEKFNPKYTERFYITPKKIQEYENKLRDMFSVATFAKANPKTISRDGFTKVAPDPRYSHQRTNDGTIDAVEKPNMFMHLSVNDSWSDAYDFDGEAFANQFEHPDTETKEADKKDAKKDAFEAKKDDEALALAEANFTAAAERLALLSVAKQAAEEKYDDNGEYVSPPSGEHM